MADFSTLVSVAVFAALAGLLMQKEILRALGRFQTGRWRLASNVMIGVLLVIYGLILYSRFLAFSR